ncbi:hypothetical protein [Haloferula rosea]|uniref:Tetratricopeptide repeat protein n=1 Tax=Haloferula rosea TaxID=490093 RepID=A0A934R8Y3_9BACT|nr:hypothetical protein [Haloferula rosea]MBK1826492.1 hypothetical protein [Haloferula rosea]
MKTFSLPALVSAAFLFAGCATTEQEPTVLAEARSHSRDGNEAYREGRLDDSRKAYGRALEIHRSVDHPEGIIRDLINLAVVSEAHGSPADAADCLDAIDRYMLTLRSSGENSPSSRDLNELLLEAGWMRAYLHADAGNTAAARRALTSTLQNYGPAGRKQRGRFLNLEARLDLEDGNAASALTKARQGLKANQRSDHRREVADSHRIIGRALIPMGDPSAAHQAFTSALELDRKQGRPDKVVDDLLGMARASQAAGNPAEARAAADRAIIAARSSGNPAAQAEATRFRQRL